jgi:hypothetical protein
MNETSHPEGENAAARISALPKHRRFLPCKRPDKQNAMWIGR